MTWNEAFRAYVEERFSDGGQQAAAFSLKTTPSNISYWCNGKLPREKWRRRIDRWSGGRVPWELHVHLPRAS